MSTSAKPRGKRQAAPASLDERYDVVVVGAGPAGASAALSARRGGASVLLLDRAEFPRPRACAGWIGARGAALAEEIGLAPVRCGAAEFHGVRLRSWDLKKESLCNDAALVGWVVDRATFDAALVNLAVDAGAAWRAALTPERVALREDRIELTMSDGQTARGQVLIVADGMDSPTARLAGLSIATHAALTESLLLEASLPKAAGGLEVIFGPGRSGTLATLVRAGARARLTALTREPGAHFAAQVTALIAALKGAGLLPAGADAGTMQRLRVPAGAALDVDTHVGKRALVVGNAGGFVASFSGEGVYPAMKSGWIAGRVAADATRARVIQEHLATFDEAWRTELAEYLRPPNTDLGLLLPLIFGNAQMSRRVAGAFLLGEQF